MPSRQLVTADVTVTSIIHEGSHDAATGPMVRTLATGKTFTVAATTLDRLAVEIARHLEEPRAATS